MNTESANIFSDEQKKRLRQAKESLAAAALNPYDHEGKAETAPAADWAHAAARGIMNDLCGRKGVGNELEECEYELRKDIVERVADIIRAATPGAEDVKDSNQSI